MRGRALPLVATPGAETPQGGAPPSLPGDDEPRPLVSLLGEPRATIVELLRANGEMTASDLADALGVTDVAVRRHLQVLDEDGFVTVRTVRQPRGRPVGRYRLTDRARNLYPQRYAAMATELLEFIASEHGREGLRAYLRWRLERETGAYAEAVTAGDLEGRLNQLAAALTAAGYEASVTPDGDGFQLTQEHCTIYDVARDHPEMCTYEAATFSRVLGGGVALSRRETLAGGSPACVCTITTKPAASTAGD